MSDREVQSLTQILTDRSTGTFDDPDQCHRIHLMFDQMLIVGLYIYFSRIIKRTRP